LADARARVLAIGGLDPSGGAGITAVARVLELHDVDVAAVATAWTVQHRGGASGVGPVAPELLGAMLDAALEDGPVHAIQTGLFASPESIDVVAARVARAPRVPLVVDPVLAISAGGWAAGAPLTDALARRLIPHAALVTPNLSELDALAGGSPDRLLALGAAAVLVKDGHGQGETAIDELVTCAGRQRFAHARLRIGAVHGTGCALAASIAARLARGEELPAAVAAAIDWLAGCLAATPPGEPGRSATLRLRRMPTR
jgi:hydroxymethylpyrimidine/phosphomethylpyrimidine kinase